MDEKVNNKLRLPSLGQTPWLMYTHGSSKRKQFQTFYNFSTSATSHIKSIPELRHKIILRGYHDDWLALADCNDNTLFCLFNLVTLKVINLPPLHLPDVDKQDFRYILWAFTSPPDCHDCVLVFVFNDIRSICSLRPAQPNSSWVSQSLRLEGQGFFISSGLVVLDGVMYGFGTSSGIIGEKFFSLNPNSLTLTYLPFPEPAFPKTFYGTGVDDKLLESCHRLYHIKILYGYDFEILAMVIFELDSDGKFWREIKSLDGRAFFLGEVNNTWCWGTTKDESESESESEYESSLEGGGGGIQGNCIYFCLLITPREEPPLVVYNLQEDSFLPLHPCPNLAMPCSCPVWVISEHQRFKSDEGIKKVDLNHQVSGPTTYQNVELSRPYVRQESKFSELPLDVVDLVSKCMHLFEYWNFRATSKAFRSLCPLPQCRSDSSLPLLLLFKNNGGLCELIDPCRHDLRFNVRQSSPDPFSVQFSSNGWVLTLVAYKSLQYFNLFTGLRGDYPPFEEEEDLHFRSIAFSTHPTSSECLTVAMVVTGDVSSVDIYYLLSGDKSWKFCILDCQGNEFHPSTSNPIFHAGAFYFLDMRGYLGVFQLVDGRRPSWQVFNKPQLRVSDSYVTNFCSSYLIECAGEIYSVFVEKMGKWVQVFRFDHSIQHWIETPHLENHTLFISRASSFSIVSEDRKMRNRIYFPRLWRKNNIVFYSLDTRNYHVLDSDYSRVDLYGATEPLMCCWV